MTLKFKIETLEGLSEDVSKLYVEKDGAFFLDVEGAVSEADHDEVKSKYVSAKDEAIQNRLTAKDWKSLGESPAEVRKLMDAAKKGGAGAEDAQARLDAMAADHKIEIDESNARFDKMSKRNATSELKTELAKAGFHSDAIDDIASGALSQLKFSEDGTMKVTNPDGTPMSGNGPEYGATLADFAKKLTATKAYALRSEFKNGGEKPAGSQGGTPNGDNPWKPETRNLTKQAALLNSDPDKAKAFKAEAGIA